MNIYRCMGCMQPKTANGPCPYCGFDENRYTLPYCHLPLATILDGRYLLGKALNQGGFGITYLAWDLQEEIKLAIKEYFPCDFVNRDTDNLSVITMATGKKGILSQKGLEKFIEEAMFLLKNQSLPGIVKTKGYFQENKTAYIVMELLDKSLIQILSQNGTLSAEAAFSLLSPVIDTLEEIHKTGLIHRDISPDNIMVDQNGRAKLIDFGAARIFDDEEKSLSVILKYRYAPVEQFSRHGQGPWTDVYALCATIYLAITGTPPVNSMDRLTVDSLKMPSALGIPIPYAYEAVLAKGLAIYAKDRFQTMGELKAALMNNLPVAPSETVRTPARETPVLSRTQEKPAKNKSFLLSLFAAAAAFCTIFFLTASLLLVGTHQTSSTKTSGSPENQTGKDNDKPEHQENGEENIGNKEEKPAAVNPIPANSAEDDGNLFGNTHCYARMVSDQTYLYFRNGLDQEHTYWIKKGETAPYLLTDVFMKDLHYKDGWIYYCATSGPNSPAGSTDKNIYRMRIDGNGNTNLTNLAFDNPESVMSFETMADGKCFFYYTDGNGISIDIGYVPETGGTPVFLSRLPGANAPANGLYLNVIGHKVYYLAKDGLHMIDIDTMADQMVISGFSCNEYLIYDGKIYYSLSENREGSPIRTKLCRINLDGTSQQELFVSPVTSNAARESLQINLYQDKLYFLLTTDCPEIKTLGRLYTANLDGSDTELLLEDVSWFNIIDHTLYYRYVDLQNSSSEEYRYAPYYFIPFSSLIQGDGLADRQELFDVSPYKNMSGN